MLADVSLRLPFHHARAVANSTRARRIPIRVFLLAARACTGIFAEG
jgi:hypothetical protein